MESVIKWQTETPTHSGKYLITDKHGYNDVDYWYDTDDAHKGEAGWRWHYKEDVIAWCPLNDIKPYKK